MAYPFNKILNCYNQSFWATYCLPLFLTLGMLGLLYWKILYKMSLDWWHDPNYSHSFLIPGISLYLIWEKRDVLVKTPIRQSPAGLFVLLFAGFLYLIGLIAGELFTQRLSFVITLAGLILSYGGLPLWRILWAPVSYLIFMVPLPYILYNTIAFPLKLIATKFSTYLLHLLGVTMYSEGNLIFLPSTTLEVADACSGIRSLLSVLALSVIIARNTQQESFKRIILVVFSIPVVLLCNMFRIIITGILAAHDSELSSGFFHAFSGEVIFLAGLGFVFFLAFLLKRFDIHKKTNSKFKIKTKCASMARIHHSWITFGALGILMGTFFLGVQAGQVKATPLLKPLSNIPPKINNFKMVVDETMSPEVINTLRVDAYIMRAYEGPNSYPLWLYVGYFGSQKDGAMIHSPKHCYPGNGWSPISTKVVEIHIPLIGRSIRVNEFIIAKGEDRQLVYYWYQARNRVIANEYENRIYMIFDSITKRRSDGALVRISGPIHGNLFEAKRLQKEFIQAFYPILLQYLPS